MNIVNVTNQVVSLEERVVGHEIWVRWADVKPILEEYKDSIDNESCNLGDYSLFIDTVE